MPVTLNMSSYLNAGVTAMCARCACVCVHGVRGPGCAYSRERAIEAQINGGRQVEAQLAKCSEGNWTLDKCVLAVHTLKSRWRGAALLGEGATGAQQPTARVASRKTQAPFVKQKITKFL